MNDPQPKLEPKNSTIQKLLLYSKSINLLQSNILKDRILIHIN